MRQISGSLVHDKDRLDCRPRLTCFTRRRFRCKRRTRLQRIAVNNGNRPQFYSAKQLACVFHRDISWIYAARRRGFPMPGHRATVEALVLWLAQNPSPRSQVWNGRPRTKERDHAPRVR